MGKNPGTDTIYDIASTNGNFTVLTSLLDATGLNTALVEKGNSQSSRQPTRHLRT